MTFWDSITGNDINKELKSFEDRAKKLSEDYQEAWEEIKKNIWKYSDFTGRNLIPILDNALGMLEETDAAGQNLHDVLGDDIKGFCSSLAREEGAGTFRDKYRKKLNSNIAKKLSK